MQLTSFIKNLQQHIKRQIERKVCKYAQHTNKGCKTLIFFELGGIEFGFI